MIDMDADADGSKWISAISNYMGTSEENIMRELREARHEHYQNLDHADYREAMAGMPTNEEFFRAMLKVIEGEEYTRDEGEEAVRDILRSMGYDGITHVGGGRRNKADTNRHQVYIMFDSEQIKSADPVTYDDNGNVLLPSERFNENNGDIRYSLEDGNGVSAWDLEAERANPTQGTREWSGVQGLDLGGLSPDEYIEKAQQRAAADRADRMRTIFRDDFKGTESLDKIGVRISGSTGIFERLNMLKQADEMAKNIRRHVTKAEKKLKPTRGEMEYAKGVASGIYSLENVPADMNAETVEELSDWYFAEQGTGSDLIKRQRRDIAITLDAKMQQLMKGVKTIKLPKEWKLNLKTPARGMRQIFGDKNGERIYQDIFRPVEENEAERYRWINKQYDDVREFEDSTGKKRPLNKTERAVVQLMIENEAAGQAVAEME